MKHPECLIDRPARSQPCPRCGRPTLTAWVTGRQVRLDPGNLTITQEIAALLTGRQTYDVMLTGLPRQMQPVLRDLVRIRAIRRYAVIAAHVCLPGGFRPAAVPSTEITIPVRPQPAGDIPPY